MFSHRAREKLSLYNITLMDVTLLHSLILNCFFLTDVIFSNLLLKEGPGQKLLEYESELKVVEVLSWKLNYNIYH